jgi:biopolymer transport protein ExbD
MKPTLLRLISLILCSSLGLVSSAIVNEEVSDRLIPPVEESATVGCDTYPRLNYLVISVPSDSEFYIGRHQLHPSEIGPILLRSLSTIPNCQRVVYIKSAAQVKFETLDVVLTAARQSGIDRIEFVLDKKKKGGAPPS